MRSTRIHWTSKFLYGGFLPRKLVEYLVWRRLGGIDASSSASQNTTDEKNKITPIQAAEQETPSHPALAPDSSAQISPRRPSVSIAKVVAWQLHHHAGFVASFVSSIQHAPISAQHSIWKRIGESQHLTIPPSQRLLEGKVLLLLAKDDNVVIADEISQDAQSALGPDAVEIRVLDGGHELPVTDAEIVARTILDFWS